MKIDVLEPIRYRLIAAPTLPPPPIALGTLIFDNSTGIMNYWNGTAWVALGGNSSLPVPFNVIAFGADRTGAADSTAAFQAAINACPDYNVIYIPAGVYRITSTLLINRPIIMRGEGFASFLRVDGIGAGNDVIHFRPLVDGHFSMFKNFAIGVFGAADGRYGIYLDGNVTNIKDLLIDGMIIGPHTGQAIFADGNGAGEGNPVLTVISRCVLQNGVKIVECSDTVRFINNHCVGANPGIDVDFIAGAATFICQGNSFTNDGGGIHIGVKGTMVLIRDNEFETFATFVGSHGAVLDIDGGAAADISRYTLVQGNIFSIVNGITADAIRVNFSEVADIHDNKFTTGVGLSNDINITANAVDTRIGDNIYSAASGTIADAGTRTIGTFQNKLQVISIGASGVDTEQIRFNRLTDGNRYNSLYSTSNTGGSAFISVRVHDGVGATSQKPVMAWFGTGVVRFLSMPAIHANNAAAVAAGLVAGDVYRTGADPDVLCVVH